MPLSKWSNSPNQGLQAYIAISPKIRDYIVAETNFLVVSMLRLLRFKRESPSDPSERRLFGYLDSVKTLLP